MSRIEPHLVPVLSDLVRGLREIGVDLTRGPVLVILLCGGDKSTQSWDIVRAKAMARDWNA